MKKLEKGKKSLGFQLSLCGKRRSIKGAVEFMDKEKLQILLAEGAFFEGELRFRGTARIAGELKGFVRGEGSLIIEAGAKVSADMELDHLILLGEFSGKVKAVKSVLMEPPARCVGEVSSPSLIIKEGVFFEGSAKKPS